MPGEAYEKAQMLGGASAAGYAQSLERQATPAQSLDRPVFPRSRVSQTEIVYPGDLLRPKLANGTGSFPLVTNPEANVELDSGGMFYVSEPTAVECRGDGSYWLRSCTINALAGRVVFGARTTKFSVDPANPLLAMPIRIVEPIEIEAPACRPAAEQAPQQELRLAA